jgi:threonine aldolase
MDGARFSNALVSLGCTPAEMTWKAGVDALSFGATKNGAMMLEAVIFFDRALSEDFAHRRMRSAQLLSKGRYLGAQMNAYLDNDLWLNNARHANEIAAYLAAELDKTGKVQLPLPTQANEVFPIMPRALHDHLQAAGAVFYEWPGEGPGTEQLTDGNMFVRFVCSYMTTKEQCDALVSEVNRWNGAGLKAVYGGRAAGASACGSITRKASTGMATPATTPINIHTRTGMAMPASTSIAWMRRGC